jgi:hypothetical protein
MEIPPPTPTINIGIDQTRDLKFDPVQALKTLALPSTLLDLTDSSAYLTPDFLRSACAEWANLNGIQEIHNTIRIVFVHYLKLPDPEYLPNSRVSLGLISQTIFREMTEWSDMIDRVAVTTRIINPDWVGRAFAEAVLRSMIACTLGAPEFFLASEEDLTIETTATVLDPGPTLFDDTLPEMPLPTPGGFLSPDPDEPDDEALFPPDPPDPGDHAAARAAINAHRPPPRERD